MSIELDRWRSAADLAALGRAGIPGIPKTERGCSLKAAREKWPSKKARGKGGRGGVKTLYLVPGALSIAIPPNDLAWVAAAPCSTIEAEKPIDLRVAERRIAPPPVPEINVTALGLILAGILEGMGSNINPGLAARKAVEYYQDAISQGLITTTGNGAGGAKAA